MRTKNIYWLIAAIAVAAVTIALAAFIVVLAPSNSSAAAASVPQMLEPRLEAMAESYRRARLSPPALPVPRPQQHDAGVGDDAASADLSRLSFAVLRG
jgi:hypothetical protein